MRVRPGCTVEWSKDTNTYTHTVSFSNERYAAAASSHPIRHTLLAVVIILYILPRRNVVVSRRSYTAGIIYYIVHIYEYVCVCVCVYKLRSLVEREIKGNACTTWCIRCVYIYRHLSIIFSFYRPPIHNEGKLPAGCRLPRGVIDTITNAYMQIDSRRSRVVNNMYTCIIYIYIYREISAAGVCTCRPVQATSANEP